MTATGRDFFNAEGMYLDTVVVVVVVVDDDELGCYFLYLFFAIMPKICFLLLGKINTT